MLIHDTLCMMEATGGADAFASIKYMVPTFESFIPADIPDEPVPANFKKGKKPCAAQVRCATLPRERV